jgi:hypothetical protein
MRDKSEFPSLKKINKASAVKGFQPQYRFKEGSLGSKISKFPDSYSLAAHIADAWYVGGAV